MTDFNPLGSPSFEGTSSTCKLKSISLPITADSMWAYSCTLFSATAVENFVDTVATLEELQQKTVRVGQTVEKCQSQPVLLFVEPMPEH